MVLAHKGQPGDFILDLMGQEGVIIRFTENELSEL